MGFFVVYQDTIILFSDHVITCFPVGYDYFI